MIFNAHTHYILPGNSCWISDYRRITHGFWKQQLIDNGVVGALAMYCPPTLPFPKTNLFEENKEIWKALKKDDSLIWVPFAMLSPSQNTPEQLKSLVKNHGFKGLKLISVFDNKAYDPKRDGDLLMMAKELKIPTMIHSGWREVAGLEKIKKNIEAFPDQTYVIAHMRPNEKGCPKAHLRLLKDFMERDIKVFGELSYVDHPNRVFDAVQMSLENRLLWGDDLPWGGANTYTNLAKVVCAPINQESKNKILYENAVKLFKLEKVLSKTRILGEQERNK